MRRAVLSPVQRLARRSCRMLLLLACALAQAAAAELCDVPAHRLSSSAGTPLDARLAALAGRPVVINFWASWCEPCRDEMPALQQLGSRWRGQHLAVLTVAVADQRTRRDAFLAAHAIELPVIDNPEPCPAATGRPVASTFPVRRGGDRTVYPLRSPTMDHRDFLKTASLFSIAGSAAWRPARAEQQFFDPSPANGWRVFEVGMRAEVARGGSETRVWLPLPSLDETAWIRPMGNVWQGNAASMRIAHDPVHGAQMLVAT